MELEKDATNVAFVKNIMEFSDFGALSQVMVIEALRYYTGKIVENERPEDKEGSFFSESAWWGCAADIHRKIEERQEKLK